MNVNYRDLQEVGMVNSLGLFTSILLSLSPSRNDSHCLACEGEWPRDWLGQVS